MKPQALSPNFYKMRLIGKTGKFLFIPFVVLELLVITSTARASVIRREIIDQRHATTAVESTTETVSIINVTSTTTTTPAAIVTDTPSPIARVTSNEIANRISSSRNDKSFTIEATTPSAAATENAPSLINNEREAVEEKTTAGPQNRVKGSTTEKIEDGEAKTKELTTEKNVPQNSTDLAKESTTEAEQPTSTKLPLFDYNRYTFDDTDATQKPVGKNTTKINDYEKHFEQIFLTTPDFEQISQTTQQSFLGEGGNDEKDVDKRFDYTTEDSAIIETTTIKITSQRLIEAADPDEIKSNSTVEQNTTVLVNESEIESTNYDIATNEIRNSTTRTNGDKRAKFMNMTIPDRPEIWALASMKHVEHTKDKLGNLVNTTVTNAIPDKNGTSATKLLADWSQVFKEIDFKNKSTNNSPNSIENTLETENKMPSGNVHEQMEQENQVVSIIVDPPTSLSTGTVKPSTMPMSTISSIDLNEKGKTTSSIDKNQVDDVELVQKKYVAERTLNELKELPKSTASSPVAAAIKPTEETTISKDETATTKDESTTPQDESTTPKEEKTTTRQVEVTTTAAPSTTTNHPDVIETTAPETKLNKDFSSSVSIVSTTDETKAQTETTEDIALLTIAELSTVPTSSITNISRETTTEIVSSSTFSVESSTTESTIQAESTPAEADFSSSTAAIESTQKSASVDFQELASTRIFDISTTTTRTENKTPENAEIQARTPFNVEFFESTSGSGSSEFTSTSEVDLSSYTPGTSSETNFFDYSLESTTTSIDNSLESTKMATVAVSQTTETLPDTSVDSNSIEQLSTSTTTVESISINRHPKIAETTTTRNIDDVPTTDHDPQVGAPLNPDEGDPNGTDYNVIIAISVSVVGIIALVLLVGFLYVMRKRQKNLTYGQRCRPVSLDAYSLDNVSVYNSVRRKGALRPSKRSYGNVAFDDPSLKHNVLNVQDLAKFVDKKMTIYEEYKDVPQIIARADEVPQGCEDKNRYANVIPLPETRVILQKQNGDEKTEYINANYVRGPKDSPNYYIACQAPLESTTADFWRMIWEQNSRVIIMATDLVENGKEKCAEYLPPSITLDNHIVYGDFQITLKSREVKEKYAVSTLHVKNIPLNSWREITHFWYQWPETGVPNDEAGVIAMLLEARSCLKMSAVDHIDEDKKSSEDVAQTNGNLEKTKSSSKTQGPLTVHCSPGTGRTGTIVACDIALRSLETPKRSVDIPQIVYYVRRGRASAVQTKEQYEFIYKVAHMYATKISGPINDN